MAYFTMTDVGNQARFVIELRAPEKIEHARRILLGREIERIHIMGTIIKYPAQYNPDWSFHLDPESIDFFAIATEVCDATICYVQQHLSDAGGSFLPGLHWCPWTSKLVSEVESRNLGDYPNTQR